MFSTLLGGQSSLARSTTYHSPADRLCTTIRKKQNSEGFSGRTANSTHDARANCRALGASTQGNFTGAEAGVHDEAIDPPTPAYASLTS
jgi:D-tyrosyl-tRNA(Tyr) deacylase